MSNKMLVVYNTCGIGENPNVDGWIGKLEPLIGDEFEGLRVCHSDCGSDDKSLEKVRERFGGLISHYYVRDHLPVHITFNSCVRNCVKRYYLINFINLLKIFFGLILFLPRVL